MSGTNSAGRDAAPELLIELAPEAGGLRVQVEQGLRAAIRDGRVQPGQLVPPSRVLASDLGLSRRVISDAYSQLVAEGWLESRQGSGTRVAPGFASRGSGVTPSVPGPARGPRYNFFPGIPDLGLFPRGAWSDALRGAVRDVSDADLGYGDGRGPEPLRRELAAYLARARGLSVDPERVIVCSGALHALSLLARVLVRSGRRQVAVEDPCNQLLSGTFARAGAELLPVDVDENGINVDALAATGADVVVVTPAHQFPTGVQLSPGRRGALIDWAADGGLIIDDDYNAEFRYDRRAVGALQALAPDRVAHIGTISKSLAPGLRLGWVIPPPSLLEELMLERAYGDGCPSIIDCLALAGLLAGGQYDRHLRTVRRRYAERRNVLESAVAEHLPACRVSGVAAGLHALLHLPEPVDVAAFVGAALAEDVAVYPLPWFQLRPEPTTTRLVLGYGSLSPDAIAEAIRRLAGVLAAFS